MGELQKIKTSDLETCRGNIQNQKSFDINDLTRDRLVWLLGNGVTDINNTFASMTVPKGFETTLNSFKEIVSGKSTWHILVVYGGTGNGKTRCCEAAVIDYYDKGLTVARNRWSDIVRRLKGLMGKGDYEIYFNLLRARKYLIIDDVGSGSTLGQWEWGELEDIIDYRLEHRLITIITTNLDIRDIPPRILSRFRDKTHCRMVCNEAPDQRLSL